MFPFMGVVLPGYEMTASRHWTGAEFAEGDRVSENPHSENEFLQTMSKVSI